MTSLTQINRPHNRQIIEDDTDEEEIIFVHSSKHRQTKVSKVKSPCIVQNCKGKATDYHDLCKKHCGKKKYDKEDCAVCIESCPVNPLSCGHWIHFDCIVKSEKKECPMCKESLTFTKEQCRIFNQYRREQSSRREQQRIQESERVYRQEYTRHQFGSLSHSIPADVLIDFIRQVSTHDSRVNIQELIQILLDI